MSRIRSKDTLPERTVRSLLHRMGFRFSLRRSDLPGKPDIVMPKHKTVIFVHGCFWHQHPNCGQASHPKTRTGYWAQKLAHNVQRDAVRIQELLRLGWRVIVLWECQIEKDPKRLQRILRLLGSPALQRTLEAQHTE